jgi:hypothetical protein
MDMIQKKKKKKGREIGPELIALKLGGGYV